MLLQYPHISSYFYDLNLELSTIVNVFLANGLGLIFGNKIECSMKQATVRFPNKVRVRVVVGLLLTNRNALSN